MKNLTRVVVFILLAAMLISTFTACGTQNAGTENGSSSAGAATTDEEKPKEVTEVSLLSGIGAYKTLLEQKIQEFNDGAGRNAGVKINITTNIDKYVETLEATVKAGNSPDLFTYFDANQVTQGWVQPLDNIDGLQELIARFKDYLVPGANTFGGKTYALPLELVPVKMAYNKDLFKKAGIVDASGNAKPPVTWDELVADAKKITEVGEGKAYGYGFTYAWNVGFRRFALKSTMSSTGHGWFDNSKGEYNFTDFKPAIQALTQMYKDGSLFPGPESINIDPIRAQFAEGNIGMIVAYAYDISVYSDQFPAKCDWGLCDVPYYTADGTKYKSIALNRWNVSISSTVKPEKMKAVVEAFKFMHDKELYSFLYSNCAIIPHEADIIQNTPLVVEKKNWKDMSNIANVISMPNFPDSLITLKGDAYAQVFESVITGGTDVDKAMTDLNTRYNEAYKEAVKAGVVDESLYKYNVDMSRK